MNDPLDVETRDTAKEKKRASSTIEKRRLEGSSGLGCCEWESGTGSEGNHILSIIVELDWDGFCYIVQIPANPRSLHYSRCPVVLSPCCLAAVVGI